MAHVVPISGLWIHKRIFVMNLGAESSSTDQMDRSGEGTRHGIAIEETISNYPPSLHDVGFADSTPATSYGSRSFSQDLLFYHLLFRTSSCQSVLGCGKRC